MMCERPYKKGNWKWSLQEVFLSRKLKMRLHFFREKMRGWYLCAQMKNKLVWIQVVHEVLIRNWSKLKAWIDERREALLYKEKIIGDIEEYNSNNKTREFLHSGARLKKANKWMQENPE